MSTTEKVTIGVQYAANVALTTNPILYVNSTNGDDKNTGTITSPLKTLYEASELLQNGYIGTAIINIVDGTDIALESDLVLNGMSNGLIINCTEQTATLGTGTADGGTDQSSSPSLFAFATVVDSTQTWVANQFQGMRIEFTSGPLSGFTTTISSNTTDTIVLLSDPEIAPTVEEYVITDRVNGVILGNMTLICKGNVIINYMNIVSNGISFIDIEAELLLVGCEIASGGIIVAKGPGVLGIGAFGIEDISNVGGIIEVGPNIRINCELYVNSCIYGSFISIVSQKVTFLQSSITTTELIFESQSNASIENSITTASIVTRKNSIASLINMRFTLTAAASCVSVEDSTVYISNLQGSTTANGFGVLLVKNATVRRNVDSLITGVLGDVSFGGATAKTWAGVNGGGAANVSDYGNAVPLFVLIR